MFFMLESAADKVIVDFLSMSMSLSCPKCGVPLAADAPCRRCLLAAGLDAVASAKLGPGFLDDLPLPEASPMIGRYKLLEKLGEGGFGVVYVAEQKEPVKRRVALKVIKLGMDTRQVVARFEAERQALAMMDHPNIARVLEAGATEQGRPYFAMELVRGVPITEYCDHHELGTAQRLGLFIEVCQAVQHAHMKGIIHRDLKPSNILVTLNDGVPTPKVIDFGIAKAMHGELTDKTVFTQLQQFIGTPTYISPEQAEMSGLDIDTRADIYSLGVLLYELLTGRTPFEGRELIEAGLEQMRRILREREPARPSTRLSKMGEAELTTVAKRHGAEAPKLIHVLRGDLDWVVMKCLEKDRTRRYETASGLAADVQRHLDNQPVVARPPSTAYRFGKMVRRNKASFSAGLAVVIALLLGISISTWQAIQARRSQKQAEESKSQLASANAKLSVETSNAQQSLYDALIRQAHATRLARPVGFRDTVFSLIQRAHALDVKRKDLTELRREVAACLGDFVGLAPTTAASLPVDFDVWYWLLNLKSRLAVWGDSLGTMLLLDLSSGNEVARFKVESQIRSACFSERDARLFSLHAPTEILLQGQLSNSVFYSWTNAGPRKWRQDARRIIPGAIGCVSSANSNFVCVLSSESNQLKLIDVDTMRVAHQIETSRRMRRTPEVRISRDGRLLAVENGDSEEPNASLVDIWDLSNGQRVTRLRPRLAAFVGMSFSPDGNCFGILTGAGAAIYTTREFEIVAQVVEHFEPGVEMAFMTGTTIVALPLGQQRLVRLWDWAKKENVAVITESDGLNLVAMTEDGELMVTWGFFRPARYYRLKSPPERLILSGHPASIPGVSFSPDGRNLASVGKDKVLRIWDSVTGRLDWECGSLPGQGQDVAYSADGRFLVTTDFDTQRICLWSTQSHQRLLEFGKAEPGNGWSALFLSNSLHMATITKPYGPEDGTVTIWEIRESRPGTRPDFDEARAVKSFAGQFQRLVLSPDSLHLAFLDFKEWPTHKLYLWEFNGDVAPRKVANMRGGSPSFVPDSRRILFLDTNRSVVTYEVESGERVASFPTIDTSMRTNWNEVVMFCLSPNGEKLAISSPSVLGVDLWDPQTGRLLYSLPEQSGTVYGLAWSPDNQRLAVSRSNGDLSIWHLDEIEWILASLGLGLDKNEQNPPRPSLKR